MRFSPSAKDKTINRLKALLGLLVPLVLSLFVVRLFFPYPRGPGHSATPTPSEQNRAGGSDDWLFATSSDATVEMSQEQIAPKGAGRNSTTTVTTYTVYGRY